MPDFDGPWKEALAALFRQMLRLYRPDEAEQVNWQRGTDSQETEMQKLLPASQTGVKRIDKLFKVHLHNGEVRHYHIEIQCWPDRDFEYRIYVYNTVAELFYGDPVDSLIVLGDDDPEWLPGSYAWERSCSRKTFTFQPLKLLRWQGKEEELFHSDNPFALFVLTHLQVWATEGDDKARASSKLRLLVRGCSLKMSPEEEVDRPVLLRLIDWLLPLPPVQPGRASAVCCWPGLVIALGGPHLEVRQDEQGEWVVALEEFLFLALPAEQFHRLEREAFAWLNCVPRRNCWATTRDRCHRR